MQDAVSSSNEKFQCKEVLNILCFIHLEMSQGQWTSPVVLAVFFKHDSVQIESQDIRKDIRKDQGCN